jgi:hypothetical protein
VQAADGGGGRTGMRDRNRGTERGPADPQGRTRTRGPAGPNADPRTRGVEGSSGRSETVMVWLERNRQSGRENLSNRHGLTRASLGEPDMPGFAGSGTPGARPRQPEARAEARRPSWVQSSGLPPRTLTVSSDTLTVAPHTLTVALGIRGYYVMVCRQESARVWLGPDGEPGRGTGKGAVCAGWPSCLLVRGRHGLIS